MGTLTIKSSIEQYLITNWTTTSIQFDGVAFDHSTLSDWISVVYHPSVNSQYAFNGSPTGRILSEGVFKVFCYAKTVPLAFKLADDVKTFLNGLTITGVEMGIGSDGSSLNLENGFFEVPVSFNIKYWE